ncbi:MAG: hypothetical protein SNJ74_05960 [Fimbriimonadaceae bacterium]
MRRSVFWCLLASLAGTAHASPLVLDFDQIAPGQPNTSPPLNMPVARLVLTDILDVDHNVTGVRGVLTHFNNNPDFGSQFISQLLLNIGDNVNLTGPTAFTSTSLVANSVAGNSASSWNGFASSRNGYTRAGFAFDARVDLAPPGQTLTQDRTIEWTMQGTGLRAGLFEYGALSGNQTTNILAMIHLQSTGPSLDSTWLVATVGPTVVGDPVPEPFTMGLVAAGALAAFRKARRRAKA